MFDEVNDGSILRQGASLAMRSSKACREADHVEVVESALLPRLNSLKSLMGQNVKSPFSNIRAIAVANSRPVAKFP
jgi:hypothetical protein